MITAIIAAVVPGGLIIWAAYNLFFRCKHEHSSWPQITDYKGQRINYIQCYDCAKAFEYNMRIMKIGEELTRDRFSYTPTGGGAVGVGNIISEIKG